MLQQSTAAAEVLKPLSLMEVTVSVVSVLQEEVEAPGLELEMI